MGLTSASQTTARHEDEPIAEPGVLVRELEGDPSAEGLPDDRRPFDVEQGHQVPQAAGVGAQ